MADQQKIKQTETEIYRREGRRWPVLLGLLLAALVVATAVTLAGRWAYRELVGEDSSQTSDTTEFGEASKESGSEPEQPTEQPQPADADGTGGTEQETDNQLPANGDEGLPSTGG